MSKKENITYQKSGWFSKLIVDYLNEEQAVQPLYNRFPTLENFKIQIEEKQKNYNPESRKILVHALEKQAEKLELSEATQHNIQLLHNENTFTITTGHQLNLFTGPLYFVYKIMTTVKLCNQLSTAYPNFNFVPIYWLATEDHDFDEINHFYFKGKKIEWKQDGGGAVGRRSTEGLEAVFEEFSTELGVGQNANFLRNLFREAYLNHENLTDATRFLANELFKEYGLVILDADHPELKQLFAPYMRKEIVQMTSFEEVTKTAQKLSNYNIQVNPREINLFYNLDGLRERIVYEQNSYKINNTRLQFTQQELLTELENNPRHFSPNVILRPLYEEVILPNLCYVGGGGEIAYWLELRSNFQVNNVAFPMLLLRNSAVVCSEKQEQKMLKLGLDWHRLFLKQSDLIREKIQEFSKFQLDFSQQKEFLKQQFEDLMRIAEKTDKSFIGAVQAQQAKQLSGLNNLEKRLLKAEKRSHTEQIERIAKLQDELFPNGGLQERKLNFSEIIVNVPVKTFLEQIYADFEPLDSNFSILMF